MQKYCRNYKTRRSFFNDLQNPFSKNAESQLTRVDGPVYLTAVAAMSDDNHKRKWWFQRSPIFYLPKHSNPFCAFNPDNQALTQD